MLADAHWYAVIAFYLHVHFNVKPPPPPPHAHTYAHTRYYRIDNLNVRDGGALLVHQRGSNATGLLGPVNYLHAGGTGRLKYALVDWDGDGGSDLLVGTCGYHSVPSNTSGLPACVTGTCGENGATVLLLRQSAGGRDSTVDGALVYDFPLWVTVRGHRIAYGGQELGVSPVPRQSALTNRASCVGAGGPPGLILATPGGRHVYWAPIDLGTSVDEPPMEPAANSNQREG
jgi:hypothetical protein